MLDGLMRADARRQWQALRMGTVLGVLALAFLLGLRPSPMFVFALAGALAALVLLRRPELGLVAVLVSSLVVPFAINVGSAYTRLHLAVILIPFLLVLWLLDMVVRKNLRVAPASTNLPLLVFVLAATVSFLAGNMPWNYFAEKAPLAAQVGGWAVFVLSAAIFLLVGNQIRDLRWLKALVWIFLAVAAVVVIGRVLPPLGAVSAWLVQPGAQGSIFWVWLAALAGGQAIFNQMLARPQRLLLGGLVLLALGEGYLLGRGWASGWAPPLAAVIVLLWLRSWRLGLVVTALAALTMVIVDPLLPANLAAGDQYSIITRQAAWQIVMGSVLHDSPFVGLGPANYYHSVALNPILGWYVKFNSHNQYVDLVAQVGIVGAAAFAWLMTAIARQGWDLRTRVGDGFARGYVYACLAGLVGSLVAGLLGDWFLPFVYNIGIAGMRSSILGWMFLGGLAAIQSSVLSRRSP